MGKRILEQGVSEYLREQIVTGRIQPGATLREEHIASKLEVSRTPVREALRKLADEGFLEYTPHRGVRLSMPTPEFVCEVFDIREALEGMAARRAAVNADPTRVAQLRNRFEKLRVRVSSGDLSDVGDFIHDEILGLCDNSRLERLMSFCRSQITWFQNVASRVPGRLERSYREHDSLIIALERRDPEWAESAIRAHIRNTKDDLLQALSTRDHPFVEKALGRARLPRERKIQE